jgi:hypothetical protein
VGTTSTAQTDTLTNAGTGTLNISSVQVSGPNASDFAATNTCGSSLPANAQCTLSVTLTPSAAGVRTASVVFIDTATGSPQSITLTGTGTSGGVALSANALTFATQLDGTPSPSQSLTLTNSSAQASSVSGIAVTGTNAGDFAETNTCGSSLAADASCAITVTFQPTATGTRTAAVTFAASAASSPLSVSLTGTGGAPNPNLSPASLTIGSQPVGAVSPPQTILLTNTGNAVLDVSSITVTGTNSADFSQTNNCGASVAAGASCTITVTFQPNAMGALSASVTVADIPFNGHWGVPVNGTGSTAAATFSPASLTFASENIGTAGGAQTVTMTNSGNAALTINSIGVTGSNASDFTETNNCGASVAAGANCAISVTFKPSASGARTAAVTVTDSSQSTWNVNLAGTGAGPAASVSPASLTFASQAVGTTSGAQTIILSNSGTAALSVTSLAISGTNAANFSQTNNCGASVAAGATCTISVAFTPSASGALTAALSIADNATGSPQSVSLAGTGAAPVASLSPTSLAFAGQTVGATSPAQTITLTNSGTAALNVTGLAVSGSNASDFIQTDNCGSSVAAGGNCVISVTFKPASAGALAAAVTLTDNATGSPQSVSLTGTGATSSASLSPTSVTFASEAVGGTSAAQTVTLSNSGAAALSISSIALSGTNSGDFAQSNNCGASVAAGATCTISLTFKPAAGGTLTATLTVADNASGSPQSVSLTGTGATSAASLSATSLSFGSETVGSTTAAQKVTLTNTGDAALSISSISLTGADTADFAQSNSCGSSVAAGSNCTISVTFKPAVAGALTAAVTLTDNASGGTQSVSLSGTGGSATPAASLSVTSLSFGDEAADVASASQAVTLSNTGSASLTISGMTFTGTDPGDFSEANTCGSSLAAGGTCTIAVTFTPAATGSRTAALSIADNASGSPQSVSLSGSGTHDVMLSWTASDTAGVTGYYVYRGTTSGGESSTPLNSTPVSGTTFTDESVAAGTTYYYVIKAVGSGDTESSASGEASIAVPTT